MIERDNDINMKKRYVFGFAIMLLVSVVGLATGGWLENEVVAYDLMGDVVEIYIWEDLHNMCDELAGNYVLMNDLGPGDVGYDDYASQNANDGAGWLPVGSYVWNDPNVSFTGTFDGQNHTISGLYINRSNTNYIGLFGYMLDGEVRNVGVVDANVSGRWYVGGLVGVNEDGMVNNSYVKGNVSGGSGVGGLVGWNYEGTVSNSYATGNVSGGSGVGGLVGINYEGTLENSYATGEMSGDGYVGGLVGINSGAVENSYATGEINGELGVGGLLGIHFDGNVSNSFYNIDTVLINRGHHITLGGIFNEQYEDWFNNGFHLDIDDYSDTLIPIGDIYEISSVDGFRDLLGFTGKEEFKFRLVADINLSAESGLYIPYFAAEFYGNNHTISDLHLDITFAACIGMFGFVDGGKVSYVGLVEANVSGCSYVGGLVGYNSGKVSNSYVTGTVSGDDLVGGLVGESIGTVLNSYAIGTVSSDDLVGGLVGYNSGTVLNSYAIGTVSGDDLVGGLLGYNSGMVSNSHATGDVNGDWEIGGLVGMNSGAVSHSYAMVNVSGNREIGGVVGSNDDGTVSNSYATGNVTGIFSVGGLVGRNSGTVLESYATGAVNGAVWVGGVSGLNEEGTVSNSYATGSVNGEDDVGGVVGRNSGTVENSYATGAVNGTVWVGGVSGLNEEGTVSNSYATGDVSGHREVGGLVGFNIGTVENSYATGNVSGTGNSVGGLVGSNLAGMVSNSYATGSVIGDSRVGGLVGWNTGAVERSFWDTETSGTIFSFGGTGKTTAEMRSYSTFSDAGWDIVTVEDPEFRDTDHIWNIVGLETYPFLSWQEDVVVFDIHSLVINVHGGGSTDPVEGTHQYVAGAEVTVTAVPAEGWQFVEWTGDHEGTEEQITVTVDHDMEITAHFLEIPCYDLTISVEGSGTTAPEEGIHTYEENTEVTLKAVPSAGWIFSGWEGDVPTGNESKDGITLVMDSHKDITAVFEEVRPPAVVISSPLHGATLDTVDVTVEWVSEPGTYPISYHEIQLNMGAWISVYNATEYTFEELENGEYNVTVKAFDIHGNHTAGHVSFSVEVPEPEFIPENLVLVVNPLEGQAPLEVTITISGDNMGDADGALHLLVNGSAVHTLMIPAHGSAEHNQTYIFETTGIYEIAFGELSKNVTVEDGSGGTTSSGLGMFMWVMILIVMAVAVLALVIFMRKKGNNDREMLDDSESEDYT